MIGVHRETLNRFPLRGTHLVVLASADGLVRASALPMPEATGRRAMADLVRWGLMRPHAGARGRYEVVDARWTNLAQEALGERPDLPDLLDAASAMAVLASLPSGPRGQAASGLSAPTWRSTVRRLHEVNLVARVDGAYVLQPRLGALERLVAAFRDLQATWCDDWAEPANPHGPVTVLPLHQRGVEAVWRLRNAGSVRLPALDWGQAPFEVLNSVFTIVYRGPRTPDLLDWALWLVCAESDLDYRVELDTVARMDPRIIGLAAAGFTAGGLSRSAVRARFDEYGLSVLHGHLQALFSAPGGAAWMFRRRYIEEFGVQEGLLEAH